MTLTYAHAHAHAGAGAQPFRHLLLALLVPLSLTAGLLTFPTVCACGEQLPHDHALFTLAGHQHASAHAEHTHAHNAAGQGAADAPSGSRADVVQQHGVTVASATTNASGDAHALLLTPVATLMPVAGVALMRGNTRRADLWRGAPPAPPPRA
jgi:hypothetical protein